VRGRSGTEPDHHPTSGLRWAIRPRSAPASKRCTLGDPVAGGAPMSGAPRRRLPALGHRRYFGAARFAGAGFRRDCRRASSIA
jgi:hypothetical protein